MPKPDSGIPRWETKAVVEVRIGIEGQVWLWHQGRTWPCVETLQVQAEAKPMAKKQRNLRPRASPLQTIPGEHHSPGSNYSNYSLAQPAGDRQYDGWDALPACRVCPKRRSLR